MSSIPLPENSSSYYPPIYAWAFKVVSFPPVLPPKPYMHLFFPHTCYMPRLSHSSRFDRQNNIWWGVQIIKLLIMYFFPLPCYPVPLRPKYSLQHPILIHPQPAFSLQCERPCFTPIQHNRQNYSSVIFIFWDSKLEDKRFCTEW